MSGTENLTLQKQINEIDTELYNLLMKRTELVKQQPENAVENTLGKEAAIIKMLLKNHKSDFPEYVIAKIWREILSASAGLKEKLKISVFAKDDDDALIRIIQEHFGSYIDYVTYNSFGAVMNELSSHNTCLAVIPCDNAAINTKPWWAGFSASDTADSLRIVAKLPFLRNKEDKDCEEAYVVALSPTDQSGSDISLVNVETHKDISASTVVENLENSGFTEAKVVRVANVDDETKFCLVEVNGYITPDKSCVRNAEKIEIFKKINIVGTYAKPIVL